MNSSYLYAKFSFMIFFNMKCNFLTVYEKWNGYDKQLHYMYNKISEFSNIIKSSVSVYNKIDEVLQY